MLLRQDSFVVLHGRRKALRKVFLFEEMIIFSKAKRNSLGREYYSYKSSIKVCKSYINLRNLRGPSTKSWLCHCFRHLIWVWRRVQAKQVGVVSKSGFGNELRTKRSRCRELLLTWRTSGCESCRVCCGNKPLKTEVRLCHTTDTLCTRLMHWLNAKIDKIMVCKILVNYIFRGATGRNAADGSREQTMYRSETEQRQHSRPIHQRFAFFSTSVCSYQCLITFSF